MPTACIREFNYCELQYHDECVMMDNLLGGIWMRKAFLWIFVALWAVLPVAAQDATVKITFPPSVYVVSGVIAVQGTVNTPDLQAYYLEVAPYGVDQPNWTPLTLPSTTPVSAGVLGQLVSTLVPDGLYQLR